MCLITYDREKIGIDVMGEIIKKGASTIKFEGVYMFGGITGT